jgi:hypothetical protein
VNPLRLIALKLRDILGLPSLQEMFPRVYAGDFGDAQRTGNLKKHGISVVFNLAWEIHDPAPPFPFGCSRDSSTQDGIVFLKYGLLDCYDPVNETLLKEAVEMALTARRGNKTIMGHCEGGRNRTYLWLICLYMKWYGAPAEEAQKDLQARRPELSLHQWEKDLLAKLIADGYFKQGGVENG